MARKRLYKGLGSFLAGLVLLTLLLLPKSGDAQFPFLKGKIPFRTEYQIFTVERASASGTRVGSVVIWWNGVTRYPVGGLPWKAETLGERRFCIRNYLFDSTKDEIQPSVNEQFAAEGFAFVSSGLTLGIKSESDVWVGRRANGDKLVACWYRPDKGPRTLTIEIETASTWVDRAEAKVRSWFMSR